MASLFDYELPSSPDVERLILGSIVLDAERLADVSAVLSAEDFSLEKHRRIFSRMGDLYERGDKVDRVSLVEELRRAGQLESVDGASYLVDLDVGLPTIGNLDGYIRIVKDKSTLRKAMFAAQKIMDRCASAGEDSGDILDDATALLERVREQGASKHGQWATPSEILLRHGVDSVLFPQKGSGGLKTPWPKLTNMTSGWNPGDLVIVAGRPGMGKSVIGMQQALTSASQGIGVAYISLEMTQVSLYRRLVAGISRVDAHRARSGSIDAEERRRMGEAASDLDDISATLFIDDSGAHTPAAVSAALRKLKARANVGLIVIDHLQLMKVTGRAESRHQELSEICHQFKRLAGQMNCVVVLLSQLNRSCEQEYRLPRLSDLKESGSIEEDADCVVFVHRPEMYNRRSDPNKPADPSLRGKAQLIVAKQRNGPTGKMAMTFLHEYQIFEETAGAVVEGGEDE